MKDKETEVKNLISVNITQITDISCHIDAFVSFKNRSTAIVLEYGFTRLYGKTAPVYAAQTNNSIPVNIIANLKNLTPFRLYHFRFRFVNDTGVTDSEDYTFETVSTFEIFDFAAGYSFRKLSKQYSGAAIRVRRSSDDAEKDIGFVGRFFDTVDLLTFVGSGNGFVKIWYDQSSNNRHLQRTINISQPIIVKEGIICLDMDNKRPAIYFDSIYQCMQTSLFLPPVPQPHMKIVACDFGATVSPLEYLFDGSLAARCILGTDEGLSRWRIGAGETIIGTTLPETNTKYILSALYFGENSYLRANKTLIVNGNAGNSMLHQITLAQHPALNVSYIQFIGNVSEILVPAVDLEMYVERVENEVKAYVNNEDAVGVFVSGVFNESAVFNDDEIFNDGKQP
ncbi:MAG: hypothetical protein IPH20_02175 [Bacteroidales bacterium]|nr:hypothetical protein [Bacteroidales bacterium]